MRILHVSAYFAPAYCYGGPPRSILSLCRALAQRGVELEVFTTTANGGDELPAHPEGLAVDGLHVRYFQRRGPKSLLFAPRLATNLRKRARGADVIHIHGLWNATVWSAARAADRAHCPYIVSPRGMLQPMALRHHELRKRVAYTAFDKRVLAGAALLHATSAVERQTIENMKLRVPVREIPNMAEPLGVGESTFDLRRSLGLRPDVPVVAFLGRIHPIKRIDLLIAAVRRARHGRPDLELVIAGPDERGFRASLEPLAKTLDGHLHWLGPVEGDRKRGLLEQSTVLVMCSDSESFGMSALDALAAGCPVVVTKTCPWEAIEREGAGCWVDQTDEAIADAMGRVIDDATLRGSMSEAARRWVSREFGSDHIVDAWLNAYASLAAARRSRVDVLKAKHRCT
jgi:glycosyltransferase involved in cell wall biosynthesis